MAKDIVQSTKDLNDDGQVISLDEFELVPKEERTEWRIVSGFAVKEGLERIRIPDATGKPGPRYMYL
jgi:hypothetical protein